MANPNETPASKEPQMAGCQQEPCSPSDPFVRHEVLDRASILMEMLDKSLGDHPGMVNGRLREIYERAEIALSDLYQEAGRIDFEENACALAQPKKPMSELLENPESPQKAFAQPPLVRLAFNALSDDISDRRGLKWEWTKIDEDVMENEIRPAWEGIIATVLPKWEPIETAPKDGTLVVLWDRREDFRPYVGVWSYGWKRDSDGAGDFYPTHWMPIPLPNASVEVSEKQS